MAETNPKTTTRKKKKPIAVLLLAMVLFGCQKSNNQIDLAQELRGNTFTLTSNGEKDTMTIEFKDSTFTVFEFGDMNLPWRTTSFENNELLVFEGQVIAIKQVDKNTFKGLLILEKDYEVLLEKRLARWDQELLNGIWIEEKNYDLFLNDSVVKPPVPPVPPGLTDKNFQYPPFYEINGDTISAFYFHQVSKSQIEINSSIEFLTLELNSNMNKVEKQWKIKKLTDSILIIDRTIEKENKKFSFLTTTEENIKLIKVR